MFVSQMRHHKSETIRFQIVYYIVMEVVKHRINVDQYKNYPE